jgi:murein hydrolase activator
MHKHGPYLPIALCFGALVGMPARAADSPAPSGDSQHAHQQLDVLRARIGELGARILSDLKQRDTAEAGLRQAEITIAQTRRRIDSLRTERMVVLRQRAALNLELAREQYALQNGRAALAGQIRAAYMIGRQEQIKLLLNQTNPAAIGRMLAYHGYFARAQARQIAVIAAALERMKALAVQIDAQEMRLAVLADEAHAQLSALVSARALRAKAVEALNQRVENSNQTLLRLKSEEQSLQSLLAQLQRVAADFPTDTAKPFESMKGKLPWPVAGKVSAAFHGLRANSRDGGVKWNGIMIDAAPGATVRAPYFGRVIYADWLQGLGLLLIIEHDNGYMSLYGHAEVLYKGVGDWVSPGDIVAAVGNTAGATPQLYFEIRQERKAVDPRAWLK